MVWGFALLLAVVAIALWQSGAFVFLASKLISLVVKGGETGVDPHTLFPELAVLQESWQVIQQEYRTLAEEDVKRFDRIEPAQRRLATYGGKAWNVFIFTAFGLWIKENCERCPRTTAMLRTLPNLETAMFSVLEPRKQLPRHKGPFRGILRYHLGLVIPQSGECYLEVADQRYFWKAGEGVMFDDTLEHAAANLTDERRVVLFLDLRRRALPLVASLVCAMTVLLLRSSARIQLLLQRARVTQSGPIIP